MPSRPSRRAVLGLAGGRRRIPGRVYPRRRTERATVASSSGSSTAASAPSPGAAPTVRNSSSTASTPTASPAAGPDITHGPRSVDAVALTFHGDGPESIVRETIAVLRKARRPGHRARHRPWLAANPELAARIRDAGHELGQPHLEPPAMPRLDAATVRTEVDRRRCRARPRAPATPGAGSAPPARPQHPDHPRGRRAAPATGAALLRRRPARTTRTPGRTRSSARTPAPCGRGRSSACTWATPGPRGPAGRPRRPGRPGPATPSPHDCLLTG